MVDLSICLPSIRTDKLGRLYNSIPASIGNYSYELIIVSPYDLPDQLNKNNVKFIKNTGCPTKCLQLAAKDSEGRLITTASDDGIFVENALALAISVYENKCRINDAVVMRYTEGYGMPQTTKAHADPAYWTPHYHPSLRLKGISNNFRWGPLLINNEFFKEVGGFDCQFEHYNYCLHDLCYRIQQNGSIFHLSQTFVMNCEWDPNAEDYKPVAEAGKPDYRKFRTLYKRPNNRFKIDFNNWEKAPDTWRRFK